jgi:hypothetical protein
VKKAVLGAIILTSVLASGASANSIFLPASGPSCLDRSKESFGLWRCPGPAGYVVEFSDEGNMVGIGFAKSSLRRADIEDAAQWQGSGKVFGDKIQWVMQGGKPGAAIIRIWRNKVSEEGNNQEIQELAVFKLGEPKACQYAAVNVKQPSANEVAEKYAVDSLTRNCPEH